MCHTVGMSKPLARIAIGKLAVAKCGHRGEHVIGQYIQCLEGCELDAAAAPPIHDFCPRCKGKDLDLDYYLGDQYYFWNPSVEVFNWRCNSCGHLRRV